MKNLWAPWRVEYITKLDKTGCFLCKCAKEQNDRKNLVLKRGKTCFCVMNRFPYNSGHVMIAPRAHKAQLKDLDKDELLELMLLTIKMQEWIKKVLKPDGFNIGINIGRIAGAGVVDHLHIHIVPRWNGDTNFMPIFTNTKVVSRAIDNLYVLLRKKNDEN